jgi:plastocyanin
MYLYSPCRWMCTLLIGSSFAFAQGVTLTAHVQLQGAKHKDPRDTPNVVLWLSPVNGAAAMDASVGRTQPQPLRLTQRNKSFDPHVLVVPVGSVVEFPNRDPFFHNVFSLFEGKRFDLGLYEAGSTRDVRFDRPGISYIFCNIHAQMSAVVIALDTPYYGVSDHQGQIEIPRVPPGRYLLHAWYETALPDTLNTLTREITVTENSAALGLMRLTEATLPAEHKNKYGRDYDKPTPESSIYPQQ